jgi:hypothetical protein
VKPAQRLNEFLLTRRVDELVELRHGSLDAGQRDGKISSKKRNRATTPMTATMIGRFGEV